MANILLLGPERERAAGIRSLLKRDSHRVIWHRSVDDWRVQEQDIQPDLVVAALESADELAGQPQRQARGFRTPVLLVREDGALRREPCLPDRLVDHISSPFMSDELLARVDALVRVHRVIHGEPAAKGGSHRERSIGSIGRRLGELLGARIPSSPKPLGPYLEVAARVADWADSRDAFEPGHAERVSSMCAVMADEMGMDPYDTSTLLRAAMLHDIGKVALPVEMLHQQSPLEEAQLRLIRTHPRRGAALVRVLDDDDDVAQAILLHHERPDGAGYYGCDGGSVPLAARILAVAEVYDAMTTSKLKSRISREEALSRLQDARGERFDAECVDALVRKLRPRPDGTIPLGEI